MYLGVQTGKKEAQKTIGEKVRTLQNDTPSHENLKNFYD